MIGSKYDNIITVIYFLKSKSTMKKKGGDLRPKL